MSTESDLRDLLKGPDPEGRGDIDLDAVLSRTRRRRRPRVIAAQALGSVALVGVLGTAVVIAIPRADQDVQMTAEDAAAGSDEAATAPFDGDSRWMPDVCGASATDPVASDTLALDITIPTTIDSDERVPVTITLRNDGPDRIVGSSGSAPYVSLASDGIVVWHSYAIQDASARVVDLDPGESMTYESYFERVVCATEDDLVMDDQDGALPLARPGDYELRAVIVVATEAGDIVLATAPPHPVEIR